MKRSYHHVMLKLPCVLAFSEMRRSKIIKMPNHILYYIQLLINVEITFIRKTTSAYVSKLFNVNELDNDFE